MRAVAIARSNIVSSVFIVTFYLSILYYSDLFHSVNG